MSISANHIKHNRMESNINVAISPKIRARFRLTLVVKSEFYEIRARIYSSPDVFEFLHPLLRDICSLDIYLQYRPRLHIAAPTRRRLSDRGCSSAVRYVYDKLRISKLDRFIAALLPSFSSRARAIHFFPRTLLHRAQVAETTLSLEKGVSLYCHNRDYLRATLIRVERCVCDARYYTHLKKSTLNGHKRFSGRSSLESRK